MAETVRAAARRVAEQASDIAHYLSGATKHSHDNDAARSGVVITAQQTLGMVGQLADLVARLDSTPAAQAVPSGEDLREAYVAGWMAARESYGDTDQDGKVHGAECENPRAQWCQCDETQALQSARASARLAWNVTTPRLRGGQN